MIERASFLCKLYDFSIGLRWNAPCIYDLWISRKFFYDTGANAHLWVPVEYSDLLFTAVRTGNIIAVHSGDQFILAVLDALIQRIAEAAVLRQPDNVQSVAHLLLLFSNNGI